MQEKVVHSHLAEYVIRTAGVPRRLLGKAEVMALHLIIIMFSVVAAVCMAVAVL